MKVKNSRVAHRSFDELVIEHLQKDPKLADLFLKNAFKDYQEDGDEKMLFLALKQLTIARGGFSDLSKKTGLSRESLYKTLSITGNPKFQTLKIILESLGYVFAIKPMKKKIPH